jgi:protein-disulfide isomerase
VAYAKELGLDTDKFTADIETQVIQDRVKADVADGDTIKVNSTPTIYINNTLVANYTYDTLKAAVDEAIKSQG